MHMLYNSDHYAVVQFEAPVVPTDAEPTTDGPVPTLTRGGYEIVDKFSRKELFIEGAYAEEFKQGVQALIATGPSEDEVDAFVGRFAALAHQPVVLH